jgi:hypothetical protein
LHVKSRDFLLGDNCKLRPVELNVPILKNVPLHLEVGDVLKSGADYTHVGANCQPIFTPLENSQCLARPVILTFNKQQAFSIAAN